MFKFKILKKISILVPLISIELYSLEYQLKLKSGWQLIGLPADISNMRPFNNENVRLVWYYNGQYGEWEGYSPEKELRTKIEELRLNQINFVDRWQGLWVFSKIDWSLIIDDSKTLTTSSDDISIIKLYKGWNLVSLPFNAVYSQKIFDGYKVWRYLDINSSWQTNQKYEILSFPEIDEINSKDGFWVYSPEYREVDLSIVGSKLSIIKADTISERVGTFKTISEVENYIKKSLLVSNRERKYWNWSEVSDFYSNSNLNINNSSKTTISVSNSVINKTGTNLKYSGVEQPNILKEKNRIVYYKSSDKSISAILIDEMLYGNKIPTTFSLKFSKGTYTIRDFFTTGSKLVIISDLNDLETNSSFANSCRANKTAISILDINSNPLGFSNEKHIFIDGQAIETRNINNNLYLVSKFQPCIDITYPKEWVSSSDPCNYPEDTIEYQTKCYDVEKDSVTKKFFRFNYEKPIVKNSYSLPKYQIGGTLTFTDLIDPNRFLASPKLDNNSLLFTISQIDIVTGKLIRTESLFGEYKNISFSSNSIYFSGESAPYFLSFNETKNRSEIHKLSFFPAIEYRATGHIDGEIANNFWLNEQGGYLRVASRNKYSFSDTISSGAMHIFSEEDDKLIEVGKVGELVESLYSLNGIKIYEKFAIASPNSNNRGFQIIDLSVPTSPKKSGIIELGADSELLQYSQNDNRLISVGRKIEETGLQSGIKLQIFDIKDILKPVKKFDKTLGDYYNQTHSFLNYESIGYDYLNGILSLPIYSEGGSTSSTIQTGLYIYNIDSNWTNIKNSQTDGFYSLGTISRNSTDQRSIFINENDGKTHLIFLNNGKISSIRVK